MSNLQRKTDELWSDGLRKVFTALVRNHSSVDDLNASADDFKLFVEIQSRDLTNEKAAKFFSDVNLQITIHVKGGVQEKIAAMIAVRKLLSFETEGYIGNKITQMGVHIRECIECPDVRVIKLAVKCLQKLASMEGTLAAEYVEGEIRRCFTSLETVQADNLSGKRQSAVLCLEALARKAPTLFFVHVEPFFSHIWAGLLDRQAATRESSAESLRAVLQLISVRKTNYSDDWYKSLYLKASSGLDTQSLEIMHGSLLAMMEIMRKPTALIRTYFEDIVRAIMKLKESKLKEDKSGLIRVSVIESIPLLAGVNPELFVENHQKEFLKYLLDFTVVDQDRGAAFLSLGKLALAVSSSNKLKSSYLEATLKAVKSCLTRGKNKISHLDEVMDCMSLLSEAAGPALSQQRYIHDILPLMFFHGLRESLGRAVTAMATHVPSLLPDIQERLLNTISMILARKSYNDILTGSESKVDVKAPKGSQPKPRKSGTFSGQPPEFVKAASNDKIPLALRILGTFDFETHQLGEFVRDILLNFLDQDDPLIRKEAALTCAKIAIHPGEEMAVIGKTKSAAITGDITSKLLIVGISDPEPMIRKTVLSSLDYRYDAHLASTENLRSLFMGLNDEVFEIRSLSIGLIGRLAIRNPSFVMPSLRKTLVQLVTELEFSGNNRNKEECVRLLTVLIQSSGPVMKPYAVTILNAILPKVHDQSARVSSAVLAALGELSRIAQTEMKNCTEELFPLLLETLQDQSNSWKREVALRALRQLCSNLGYVIIPYEKYPNLLTILLNAVKTEQNPHIRLEVLKVLGILGALDPYRHRLTLLEDAKTRSYDGANGNDPVVRTTLNGKPENDEYYASAALDALTKILRNASLQKHHLSVITVIMYICKSLGAACVKFLPQIIPLFVKILRSSDLGINDMLFQQISILVVIAKEAIREYLDDIFSVIHEYWNTTLVVQILGLVERLVKVMGNEIKVYLPDLVPLMLKMLHSDDSDRRLKVLSTLDVLGVHLADYLHLVVPTIVKLFERIDLAFATSPQKSMTVICIQTLGRLCSKLDMSDYASRITHPLLRILDSEIAEIQQVTMDTICVLIYRLGSDYAIFIPIINKKLAKLRIQHELYETLVSALLKNQSLDSCELAKDQLPNMQRYSRVDSEKLIAIPSVASKTRLSVNTANLKKAWESSHVLTKEDWVEWMRRFSVALLKESPSPALRQCLTLAQVYHPLARTLFNHGFFSCWVELDPPCQMDCLANIKAALDASDIPPETLHTLLNLAEFMEHNMHPLPYPVTNQILGTLAEKFHAYAKALHYKEQEFEFHPTRCIEALISINNQLGLPEAAGGILTYAQQHQGMQLKESWYEKLHRWEEALAAYESKQEEDPDNVDLMLGMMRCYHALGEWDHLSQLARSVWQNASSTVKISVAPMAAAGFWNLGKRDSMEKYVEKVDPQSVEGTFYRAVMACHKNKFAEAQKWITETRKLLDTDLTALVSESYKRAYDMVCRVQQLSELEEVIEYKLDESRRPAIRKMWMTRILGCQRNVEVWQGLLSVRALVLPPAEDVDVYLKYSSLLRSQGRLRASSKILNSMMDSKAKGSGFTRGRTDPRVYYHFVTHTWAAGSKHIALQKAKSFVKALNDKKLQARMYYKIAEWKLELEVDNNYELTLGDVLSACKACTENDPNWYKAWHTWALMNFEAVSFFEKQDSKKSRKRIVKHLVAAINGFFRSIALSPGKSLQDTLRLLTLMFKHGAEKEAEAALIKGFATVSVDTWLQVIPQIIARIHSPNKSVRFLVKELLQSIGEHHPQSLVYPLTVASTSHSDTSISTASSLLQQMRQHSEMLVDQAMLVSTELIRVSINWFESWHVGLETASRLFFKSHDIEGMLQTLAPLHMQLDAGPETLNEVSFNHLFGRQLREAQEWCRRYAQTNHISNLHEAWDSYVDVFRKITKLLPKLTKLDLQYVSPALLESEDLELAVPGTYHANEPIVRIAKFSPILTVITSKQRPRRMTIVGGDGVDYTFLLKGHEDLRQDERVMQLFGLVNTLLATGEETGKLHLRITRYGAIPLSPNSGLIGWVPGCNTLHELIKQQREAAGEKLKVEMQRHVEFSPKNYDHLSLMQKVEVYEYSIASTPGNEFASLLWKSSPNSEIWLDRRTNFTRSLALMSMVGYILGLGDRHPSNLMLEQSTGKVLHIDFGDCFEVAMHRENYPEKIPFRLTRMLIAAMEVSGIEGNFRSTCEFVMRLLREHKESLMAVLEAFVYDPLVNWRLLGAGENDDKNSEEEKVSQSTESVVAVMDRSSSSPPISQSLMPSKARRSLSGRKGKHLSQDEESDAQQAEVLNSRAVEVITRVHNKLTGQDFSTEVLDVEAQVHKLVAQATSHENLCQLYMGWCPYW